MNTIRSSLEARLAAGHDSALGRFSLGSTCFNSREFAQSIEHLERAVELDPEYSAAWALLGKARREAGLTEGAIDAWIEGVKVAERRGDLQAARQMRVFLNRLDPRSG